MFAPFGRYCKKYVFSKLMSIINLITLYKNSNLPKIGSRTPSVNVATEARWYIIMYNRKMPKSRSTRRWFLFMSPITFFLMKKDKRKIPQETVNAPEII